MVDVFLYPKRSNLFEEYRLSDCGQTYIYLKGAQVGMSGTNRKREIVSDISSQLNVKISDGEVFVSLSEENMNNISDAIMRISQACVRVSDFATHQRLRSSNPFKDDIEDFFEEKQFGYSRDVQILGQYKFPIRMDFEVITEQSNSYVNILAAMNLTAAHSAANEIFTKLYDLNTIEPKDHQMVTVYNSASKAIKETDIRRLGEFSRVISYPQQEEFLVATLSGRAD
jgi:hypothetical protein